MVELPKRGHLHVSVRSLRKTHGVSTQVARGDRLLREALLLLLLGVSSRLGKELLEVLQEIRRSVEKLSDLRIHVLDRLGLPLVGLQDLQELLVDLRSAREAVLWKQCQ